MTNTSSTEHRATVAAAGRYLVTVAYDGPSTYTDSLGGPTQTLPNPVSGFLVHSNYDGVSLSVDGVRGWFDFSYADAFGTRGPRTVTAVSFDSSSRSQPFLHLPGGR